MLKQFVTMGTACRRNSGSQRIRRGWALVACLGCGLGLLSVAPAGALAGPPLAPVALDSPGNGNAPLIAYDPTTGSTYVAWTDTVSSAEFPLEYVDICVLPSGATACEDGPTQLVDPLTSYDGEMNSPFLGETVLSGLTVLPSTGEVAVTAGTTDADESGTVAWDSPAGGSAFLTGGEGLVNNGAPTSLIDGADITFGDAFALSSTDLGLLGPTLNSCAQIAAVADTGLGDGSPKSPACHEENTVSYDDEADLDPSGLYFASSESGTGSSAAAEAASVSGEDVVVGVGYGVKSTSGCSQGGATGYGAFAATVDGASTDPGTINGDGMPGYDLLECSAVDPVLAGGGDAGIGVLEGEGTANGSQAPQTVDYRPFDATSSGGSFGAPVVLGSTAAETDDSIPAGFQFGNLDLSEDSGDGVYAIWDTSLNLEVDYSSDGGQTWGPATVIPPPAGLPEGSGPGEAEIVGTGGGTVELAYNDGTEQGTSQAQVYIESINYQTLLAANDAVTITTTQFAGNASGSSLTVLAGTVNEEDYATLTGTDTPTASGTVTYGLYSSSSCTPASEVFNAGTVTVTDGGVHPSNPVSTALASGTYYWQASYSGNGDDSAAVSPCGSEVLTISPATPSATTPGPGPGTGTGGSGSGGSGSTGTGSTGTGGPRTPGATPGRPAASGERLGGLATGHPKLTFTLTHATGGSKLSSVTIILPKGLAFVKAGLKKGVSIAGTKIKIKSLKAGKLTLTFSTVANAIKLTIAAHALSVTATLRTEIKHHKIPSLTVNVLTKAGTTRTPLKLTFTKLS